MGTCGYVREASFISGLLLVDSSPQSFDLRKEGFYVPVDMERWIVGRATMLALHVDG